MKLFKKLIPIATGLSCITAITPLTASCGNNNSTNSSGLVDLRNGYTPSVARATWKDNKAKLAEMYEFYAASISNNPQVFIQDWLWNDAYTYLSNKDSNKTNQTISIFDGKVINKAFYDFDLLEAKIENVKISRAQYKLSDEELTTFLISFDSQLNFAERGTRTLGDGTVEQYNNAVSYTYNMKNIPITMQGNTSEEKEFPTDWNIKFTISYEDEEFDTRVLRALANAGYEWKVDSNISIVENCLNLSKPGSTWQNTSLNSKTTIEKVADLNDDNNFLTLYEMATMKIYSFYLSSIKAYN